MKKILSIWLLLLSLPLIPADFEDDIVEKINYFRRQHKVPRLKLNKDLSTAAMEAAYVYALGKFAYVDNPLSPYTENGCIMSIRHPPTDCIEKWYNEGASYDFKNPNPSIYNREFAVLMWRSSREVGIGYAMTPDLMSYCMIVRLAPAGLQDGEFEQNVTPRNQSNNMQISEDVIKFLWISVLLQLIIVT
ncbi:Golgi-associated plant pathogenesis-related protein 1-like [Scaptodrosophila lebanonensis]|uniref:Golgi-associated plant pathogenesis-related protein 1-like n=1 Tax=Drosophila lebanonensis TaxID=7225 RepID=A0A6J2TE79_DROLE|nr:Golgi-associated plant pathogenesis-related protein 1-like [Scaptodrosophila lebanonensis]